MVVQVTNTGSDLAGFPNHFDLQLPGGGVGLFTNGCSTQYGAPATGWGAQYGGVSSDSQCSQLPTALQPGCHFIFGWFQNANNPTMSITRTVCPTSLTTISGCKRSDDSAVAQKSYASM